MERLSGSVNAPDLTLVRTKCSSGQNIEWHGLKIPATIERRNPKRKIGRDPMHRFRHLICALVWLVFSALAAASPYRGVVTFGGLPLPGATVTATQGTKSVSTVSDQDGAFAFDDLADGKWTITVEMQCFEPMHADITVAPKLPAAAWEMKLLPIDQLQARAQSVAPTITIAPAPPAAAEAKKQEAQQQAQGNTPEMPKPPEENEQSADGFLVQGSVNNAATSIYSTNPAFGNTRLGTKALYTGGFAAFIENSGLDARPYSLAGRAAEKPSYNDFTGVATLQGPIVIPFNHRRGPSFFLSYQWTRNSTSQILPGLVPTPDEQVGNLAGLTNALGQPVTIYNPYTGQPYTNNQIPVPANPAAYVPGDVSPVAAALLKLYPPNPSNSSGYNYQAPSLNDSHQDALQAHLQKGLGRKDQFYGLFAFQSTRADNVNLFNFIDHTGGLGITGNIHWTHRLKPSVFLFTGYTFSRMRTELRPNFANRENVSGMAGITAGSLTDLSAPGSLQDPADWGPPSLSFSSSGINGLNDANSSFNRNRTDDFTASTAIYHSKHNITVGGEFRKQEYNELFQENPRGGFQFTGAATMQPGGNPLTTGSDLADFLIGVPDTSNIAYGNADKYFREPVYAVYMNDDWRLLPILSVNWGVRWDYSAPMTELQGRLVNLDVANGFTNVAPVVGSNPVGSLTGNHYPSSLIRPDRSMVEPRVGIAWRPIPASTVVIRAGYGLYPDTSVYQNIILQMAQQAPLSKSLSVSNSAACPLTLASGFTPCAALTSDTYGIDPNFRVGYAQEWKLEVQRDLPFALQLTATYLGTKGTHGPQEILPNSYPLFGTNPCPSCPSGFVYETSGGNSIHNAGALQLRRRLRSGFAASLAYTYSKSIDDNAYLGGQGHTQGSATQSANLATPTAAIAQNWLDPQAERSLSSFDQRNLLNVQGQYTSGQGLEGGTLLGGWRGRALKEWTLQGTFSYGTGMPQTPLYPAAVPGTGFSGIIRPNLTGAPIYSSGTNAHLNINAYTAPAPGQWGDAGRDSITGPNQLTFNSSLARTFRPHGKSYLDFALISTNTLNHPSFTSWNTVVTSPQLFGLPTAAGATRGLQISMHLRFQ
jgi:trimeric autotransporter adhesin